MGRPSKQKSIVDQFFTKYYYVGNIEKRKCLLCKEAYYVYNAFRLAKHLLMSPKTDSK